jgi:quercetin dioxygenase-like cupin family protein
MTESTPPRTHPSGQTSGSSERPAERLVAPTLTFDLASGVAALKQEPSWQRGDRNGRTLAKEPSFRVVLTALKTGARLREHGAAGPASIQTLAGRLRVQLPGQVVELSTGGLLTLEPKVSHEVEALEESAFLLTIAQPGVSGP